MTRSFLIVIVVFSAATAQVFGQQYSASTGGYYPPYTGLSPLLSPAAPVSEVPAPGFDAGTPVLEIPAPDVAGTPYATPYPPQYPALYPASYPEAPSEPDPGVLNSPYAAPNALPYGALNAAQYPPLYSAATPEQSYETIAGTVYPGPDLPQGAPSVAPTQPPPAPLVPPAPGEPAAPPALAQPDDAAAPATGDPAAEKADPQAAEEDKAAEAGVIEQELPEAWYYFPMMWFDPWEGNVELGLSGSEGNTQTLNYLLGVDAKRETKEHILNFDLKYDRKSADSIETAHRLFSEIRWELLFKDTAWTWYFHESTEYDEFKDFDIRLSYDTGLGRSFIKNDTTSFLGRVGAGTSHEIGGVDNDMVPEAVFGLEFKHKINNRQKLSASGEYVPDVTEFPNYRLNSKASWEVVLDEETNLSLKVSILDRYDSTPNGKEPNDLDYTLTLLWNF